MKRFQVELEALNRRVVEMGQLAESMVADAWRGLAGDTRARAAVTAHEPTLDRFQIEIDRDAIRLITVYAPVARDLRLLLMIARVTTELERIGDQAVNNCEYTRLLGVPQAAPSELATLMARVSAMLHEALDAFAHGDTTKARAVMQNDDAVDALYTAIFKRALENPGDDQASRTRNVGLLLTARTLERIADHATNICEEVFYVVEGADVRHET